MMDVNVYLVVQVLYYFNDLFYGLFFSHGIIHFSPHFLFE